MGEKLEAIRGRLRELWLYLAAVVVFLLVAGSALIWLPEMMVTKEYWLDPKTIFDMKNEARRTITYSIGGILAVIGIGLTFWRHWIAQEGQITERFTRAIEQLGSTEMAIRLGGIYALERIAFDSKKDYWPIMETLTAYVRERASFKEISQAENGARSLVESAYKEWLPFNLQEPKIKPTTDIQAILTVLGRRKYQFGQGENQPLNLRFTDLRGADLFRAHLEDILLTGAHLEGANLIKAHLERADLSLAHLEDARLNEANLDMAYLQHAHLERANLFNASLVMAKLNKAYIQGACLIKANLKRAFFAESHLEESFLIETQLEEAVIADTHLEGANLSQASGLTREQLAKAIIDDKTVLPDYLQEEPPKGKGPEGNDEG